MSSKKISVFKRVLSATGAVLLMLSVAACSTSGQKSSSGSGGTSKSNETPKSGGIFTLAYSSEQRGFDSAYFNWASLAHLEQTSNTLIQGDWSKGPSGTHVADFDTSTPTLSVNTGALIEKWEFVGDDTIVLHVRHGVHYGLNPKSEASQLVNGRELVAEDIAFTIRRQFNMESSAPSPKAYALSRMTPDEYPTSVQATDPYTVQIKGKPGFIGSLFYWITEMVPIYPPEVVKKYGDLSNVLNDVGTGPFEVTDYVQNSSITFAKNTNYWEKDPYGAGKGNALPYLDGVKYLVIPDWSTQLSAFRTAKIDYIRGVSLDDFKQLTAENPKLKYAKTVSDPNGLALRTDNPSQPWYNLKVRQALQMGMDRQAIQKGYYKGDAEILAFPVAPRQLFKSLGVYHDLKSLPADVQELYTYNPTKAKQLLAEAGYPNGFTIQVVLQSSQIDQASILKSQLAKIGVTLDLQVKEDAVYSSISSGRTYKEGIFVTGLGNTPHAFHNFRPTDPGNTAFINDPTVNKMISDFAKFFMIDDTKAWPVIGDTTSYILQQSWYLTLPAPYTYTVWWPWVKNYNGEYSLGGGHFNDFTRYIWIDQDLKKSMGH